MMQIKFNSIDENSIKQICVVYGMRDVLKEKSNSNSKWSTEENCCA
ncbi:hypothetical protein KY343_01480 [Candidatus Woesearchaeota archaeon]|nr:hypothetical protein [Candidatus Woesearchaeota archaeon]